MAHDLRQDMAALSGMVASLTLDDAAGRGFAARISSEIRRQAPHLEPVPAPPRAALRPATRAVTHPAPPGRLAAVSDASGWSGF